MTQAIWEQGYTQNRELSWLQFNARVLAEAGWLKLSQVGRLKSERRLPDLGKVRTYIVVLPEDDG